MRGIIMFFLIPFFLMAQVTKETQEKAIKNLISKYGKENSERIKTGVMQVAKFWQKEDGTEEEFLKFVEEEFVSDPANLSLMFKRLERAFESIDGLFTEMQRDLRWFADVEEGPMLRIDEYFSSYEPASHIIEDFFKNKIAFIILLNFKAPTFEDLEKYGERYSREEWAKARLAQRFTYRLPAEVQQEITRAFSEADIYISNYNIYLGNVLNEEGKSLFPKNLKLISHWGLRDELKAQYMEKDGNERQELIYKLMLKIINQEVPKNLINNPDFVWQINKNGFEAEQNLRYEKFLKVFRALKKADPYYPDYPNYILRKFSKEREISKEKVKEILKAVCSSPLKFKIAKIIKEKLGRPLRPYDIWYNQLKPTPKISEKELDEIVKKRYKNVKDFQRDIPQILKKLGFEEKIASFIAEHIEVDPARGAGHAMGALKREDKAHLRTRVPEDGMNYKGFNIAMHELGHNVEQVISNSLMDYHFLKGVPNTAFTEAFAFIFQGKDLEILGLKEEDKKAKALETLNEFWMTYEIAGVALVDIEVWEELYRKPDMNAEELKGAVIEAAKKIWNEYYADVFGERDTPILAIYSHMIDAGLYLPDYPLGHIISFQIKSYLEGKNLGEEMVRMCKIGSVIPDLWMKLAVGEYLSEKPLLKATEEALKEF